MTEFFEVATEFYTRNEAVIGIMQLGVNVKSDLSFYDHSYAIKSNLFHIFSFSGINTEKAKRYFFSMARLFESLVVLYSQAQNHVEVASLKKFGFCSSKRADGKPLNTDHTSKSLVNRTFYFVPPEI